MRKTFMGVQLRRLREERGLTQVALARQLGLSASYLNQIEQNQRPLTVPVLLKLSASLGVDVQRFSDDEEARLIAGLGDVLADVSATGGAEPVSQAEVRELAAAMPALARTLIGLHGRYRRALERLDELSAPWGDERTQQGGVALPPMAYEEVRDYFFAHHNHLAELDDAAERCAQDWDLQPRHAEAVLLARLEQAHGVRVRVLAPGQAVLAGGALRAFDAAAGMLYLSQQLETGQRSFHLATQLALLEQEAVLARLVQDARLSSPEARQLARIGLANYFAGALLMPYGAFLQAAEDEGYDIERLGQRFGVGFESVCHRLSMLQRPQARGIPFIFIRVDRAGNISKRQSATQFHFSKIGGTCPLWNVYEAFDQPGRIVTQLASMPDGRRYLWVARTVQHSGGAWGAPGKLHAVALGCAIEHAPRWVYARGLNLTDPGAAVPIGMGCKVCERADCAQRAFPPLGKALGVNENVSLFAPYAATKKQPPPGTAGER